MIILNNNHNRISSQWYGVEWDVTATDPDVTRIGHMPLHASLPIHNLMKGCLVADNGTVNYYLKADDWTKKADGTASNLDGTDGQVMVEIPRHYRKFESSGNTRRVKISLYYQSGFTLVERVYVSAYEAALQRSTSKLASVVNAGADYRGGNNNAAWDAEDRTLLGKPATSISRTNFRTYARARGTGWEMYTYDVHKTLFFLFIIEYATLNSQKAYDATLTAEGYKKGGLGAGVTTVHNTTWNTWNSHYPFLNCGHSNSVANGTGIVDYSMPSGYGLALTVKSIRYRGVEHPFGHIWKNCDGITIIAQAAGYDLSEHQAWITSNRSLWQDSNITGYSKIGALPRADGYISRMINGQLMPDVAAGSNLTYWCDYFYQSIPGSTFDIRTVIVGGSAIDATKGGFGLSNTHHPPSYTYAYFGSRLCYYPIILN